MIPKTRRCTIIIAHALTGLMWTAAVAQDTPGPSDDPAEGSRTLANNSISIAAPNDVDDDAARRDGSTADITERQADDETSPDRTEQDSTEMPRLAAQETLPLGGNANVDSSLTTPPLAGEADPDAHQGGGWFGGFDPANSELLRVGGALVAVLGLLWLMRIIVKRSGLVVNSAGRPSGVLEVLARYPVGRREHLVLLKMHRRVLLVHQGDGRMSPLAEVDDPSEVAALLARVEQGSTGKHASRFNAMLDQFNAEHDHASGPSQRRLPRLRRDSADDGQVVDLTRTSGGGLLRMKRSA